MRAGAAWLAAVAMGVAWSPHAGGPSPMARRVLDSIPEPRTVAIPAEVERQSRRGLAPPSASPILEAPVRPSSGDCYEVQLTALGDPGSAAALARQEAERLGVPVRVVEASGLSKLRAGGCLDADSARALRDRARDAGYSGAFTTPAR